MHLASDYIHPYKGAGGRPAQCRVRIYLPSDVRDAPVVICPELPKNSGRSVTNSAEAIAAAVIRANELPTWHARYFGQPGSQTPTARTVNAARPGRCVRLRDLG